MALSTVGSGTQACTIDTVHTLDTETAAGVYVATWDLTNMVKGDIVRLFIEKKVLTGGTAATVYEGVYANDLGANCIIQSPPVVGMFGVVVKIEQTDGTGRNVDWSLVLVAT